MNKFKIVGGTRLAGELRVSGAKNSVLPIIAACLLTEKKVILHDFPLIEDAINMLSILQTLGCKHKMEGSTIELDTSGANNWEMPERLSKELRSSIFMLGPVIARFKKAKFTYPGGCEIGNRPIDLHLKGLRELNIDIKEEHGFIICDGKDMKGADIHLDYPSVGATENIMLAAVKAKGRTIINNAAREPEIVDLQNLLNKMGADVKGAGTSEIIVEGKEILNGAEHKLISDRIVAGTYMVAAAITQGELLIKNVQTKDLTAAIDKLKECGCKIKEYGEDIFIKGPKRPREMKMIETLPHPGFATDMQAQFFALCTIANGTSVIVENVFESRFKHAIELNSMGADVRIKDRMAIIRGVEKLSGANVLARDLRGGAALVLAGMRAGGETIVDNINFIDRGYQRLDEALCAVGANIKRV